MDFIAEAKCLNVATIKDVTDQVDNTHKSKDKNSDRRWVSCGQEDEYFELYNKYEKHFEEFDEKIIAKLMCKCCNQLKPKGKEKVTWLEFYQCMKNNITDSSQSLRSILDELIEKHK